MNQTARPTWTRYKVLLFLCVSASLAYICRNSISVAESSIRADLDLTKRETGWMMALFFCRTHWLKFPAAGYRIDVAHAIASLHLPYCGLQQLF